MKNEIIAKASKIIFKMKFEIKKHSPEILVGAGVIGTVTSTVLACKATTKVNEVIEQKNKIINDIHECLETEDLEYTEQYSKKDLTLVYVQTGAKLLKLYAPSIILGSLSISSIISGHNILRKRNLALAAAYAGLDQGFKKYRSNVVERFGEDVDKELRYNIKPKVIEKEVEGKNGKKKTEKEIAYEIENPCRVYSEFAKVFDCGSEEHTKDPEYNLMFLRRQQDYANEKLKAQGYLFLNDVYAMLDLPKTQAGNVVGWIYDEKNPNGDNFVDFGIYDLSNKKANSNFINGTDYNIILDFNVDGYILDKAYGSRVK